MIVFFSFFIQDQEISILKKLTRILDSLIDWFVNVS